MDLKDFIKQTISGIVHATTELQQEFECQGVIVNPPVDANGTEVYREESTKHTFRRIEIVEFDVAVTAASETGGGGKAGLKIFSAEASTEGKHARHNEEVSRVKFSIPLVLAPSLAEAVNRHALEADIERQRKAMEARPPQGDWLSR